MTNESRPDPPSQREKEGEGGEKKEWYEIGQEELKAMVDAVSRLWRQPVPFEMFEQPPVIFAERKDDPESLKLAFAGTKVFGGGHLWVADWWHKGGTGAPVKNSSVLDTDLETRLQIRGFVHFSMGWLEFSVPGLHEGMGEVARKYFDSHPGEFSFFVPVIFQKSAEAELETEEWGRYPWRALPVAQGL
jgi:hypothetical protein